MRNSELGCGGTEQRCGVAVALSYGDAAARGRWRGAEVARRSGDAVAWGCKLGGARCYWFSKRSSKEIDDISAWLGQQHDMETLSKKIKNRETSKSTSTFSKAAALNLKKEATLHRKVQDAAYRVERLSRSFFAVDKSYVHGCLRVQRNASRRRMKYMKVYYFFYHVYCIF
ncbi:uncharacterized protein [Miscanthus floridulus]|uniref:uncharacterized protein isoform X1 n=1 Tax=Miscanthus floridulus TaxID=154761 RepID=UPI00345AD255